MTRLGILGGGQLAQMMTQAAISLGVETVIFERQPDSPASRLTPHHIVGQWDDQSALTRFAELCDVITLESEFVDSDVLRRLEAMNKPVYASSTTLALVQDKLIQKQTMQSAGLAIPNFCGVSSLDDVRSAAETFGFPLLLPARRDGYDGYGNVTLHSLEDIVPAWEKLGANRGRELLAEAFVPFVRELAVMILRGHDGEIRVYPVVETVQENHICHIVRAPIPDDVAHRATHLAIHAVEAINGVGIFGIELFLMDDGRVLYNEIAPRPHNSGHYTIEACVTSQFENHIRAVLGWPLGDTAMIAPATVMVNLLGKRNGLVNPEGIRAALAIPNPHIHLYGKREVRIGRKMGHITIVGDNLYTLENLARQASVLVEL